MLLSILIIILVLIGTFVVGVKIGESRGYQKAIKKLKCIEVRLIDKKEE